MPQLTSAERESRIHISCDIGTHAASEAMDTLFRVTAPVPDLALIVGLAILSARTESLLRALEKKMPAEGDLARGLQASTIAQYEKEDEAFLGQRQ